MKLLKKNRFRHIVQDIVDELHYILYSKLYSDLYFKVDSTHNYKLYYIFQDKLDYDHEYELELGFDSRKE